MWTNLSTSGPTTLTTHPLTTLHCTLYSGYSEYPQCWRVIKSSGFIVACDRKRDMECANQGSSGQRGSVTTDYQRDHSKISTKS